MPRTTLTVGDYAEAREHIYRIDNLYYPQNMPLCQYADLVEVNVDENGAVTETGNCMSGVVVDALQSISYATVVLMLAIHKRTQEKDAIVNRIEQLEDEIKGIKTTLGILQANEAINGDPDD